MVFNTALESFLLKQDEFNKKKALTRVSYDKEPKKISKKGKGPRGRPRKYPQEIVPVKADRPVRIKKKATYRIEPSVLKKSKNLKRHDDNSSVSSDEEEDLKEETNEGMMDSEEEDDMIKDETFTCKKPTQKKRKKIIKRDLSSIIMNYEKEENEKVISKSETSGGSSSSTINNKKIYKKSNLPPICMSNYFQPRPIKIGPSGEPVTTTQKVARYGRIYKRKSPDYLKTKDCGQLKAAPGMRLCRMCKCLQPLDKFYTNEKRYVCKHHHYLQVKEKEEIRFKSCPYERLAYNAWIKLRLICPFLGYTHVNYDRHDMMDLMMKTQIPKTCNPHVVPIDPRRPLRPRNVAIVTGGSFMLIMKILTRTLSAAQYILMVQSCNLLPENADVGTPWDPFHNPTYKREDIDVIPILEAEKARPNKEEPYLEAIHKALHPPYYKWMLNCVTHIQW